MLLNSYSSTSHRRQESWPAPTSTSHHSTLISLFVLLAPLTSLPYVVISIHRSWMNSAVLFHSHLSFTTKYFTSSLLNLFNPCLLSTIIINCLYSSDIPIFLLFLFFYMLKVNRYSFWMALLLKCTNLSQISINE